MPLRKNRVSGVSLIEVIVAIFIMGIGMEVFSMLLIRSWDTNAFILETGMAASAASRAVNATVAELRKSRQADNGDYPIEAGDDFEFTTYIDIDTDGVTERVHYYLQNGQFIRGVREPSSTQPVAYASGDQTTTVLATSIANETSEPVFTYYNDDYPGDEVNNPLATPISVRDVWLVKIRLVINIDPNNAPDDTNIESFVEFRNLNSYVR